MATFDCDWDGLKRIASEFFKHLPTASIEEAENGLKCLNLHFLGCTYKNPMEENQAFHLFNLAGKKFLQRQLELEAKC